MNIKVDKHQLMNVKKKIHDEVKEFEDPEIFSSVGQKELNDKFDEELKKIDERRKALGLEKKRIFDDLENHRKAKEKAQEENKKTQDQYEKKSKRITCMD